jgi:hypothetical protein
VFVLLVTYRASLERITATDPFVTEGARVALPA